MIITEVQKNTICFTQIPKEVEFQPKLEQKSRPHHRSSGWGGGCLHGMSRLTVEAFYGVPNVHDKWVISTLLGTNISPQKALLKMIFLFPRWDMLVAWMVGLQHNFVCFVCCMIFWGRVEWGPASRFVQCCNALSLNGTYYDSDYDGK